MIYAASSNENLPKDLIVDKNIHMTTLDPHPWDDDPVYLSADDNKTNGKSISIGVVGWQSGKFKVKYIDNYYQNNHPNCTTHPIGLSYFPGFNKTFSYYFPYKLTDLMADVPKSYLTNPATDTLNYCFTFGEHNMNHSGIHAWYHGTIDLAAIDDSDGLRIDIYRNDWYEDSYGKTGGFNKSRLGNNGVLHKDILADIIGLKNVNTDETFVQNGKPKLFFNGDFSKHGLTGDGWLPGWEFQQGSGTAQVDSVFGSEYLTLENGNHKRTHNLFYIPSNAKAIKFRLRLTVPKSDDKDLLIDTLFVRLTDPNSGEKFVLLETSLDEEIKEWEWRSISIKPWAGTVKTLTFEIRDQFKDTLYINSKAYIDDVSFVMDPEYDCVSDVVEPITTIEAIEPCYYSLWNDSNTPSVITHTDNNAVELGMKFQSEVDGSISAVRFYKGPTNTGTHVGSLWDSEGTLLAQATFANETESGWQTVYFDPPVTISAKTPYIASYHTEVGQYSVSAVYFKQTSFTKAPLTATNGVYLYGAGGFPVNNGQASNYWVDVLFNID
jgi:uncharacterized protein DUF4082